MLTEALSAALAKKFMRDQLVIVASYHSIATFIARIRHAHQS
jgi:hypothetical protein